MSLLNQQSRKLPVPPADPNYPAYRHHLDGRSIRVNSPAEEPSEEGWGDKMYPKAVTIADLTAELTTEQLRAELVAQNTSFNKAWGELVSKHEGTKAELENLKAVNDSLLSENSELAGRLKKKSAKGE